MKYYVDIEGFILIEAENKDEAKKKAFDTLYDNIDDIYVGIIGVEEKED